MEKIVSVEEGELIALPQMRNQSNANTPQIELVSSELIAEESVDLDIQTENALMLRNASSIGWDWWAVEVYPHSHSAASTLPLGTNITFRVRLANLGAATAPATKADLWLSNPDMGIPQTKIGQISVKKMESYHTTGQSYLYEFTFSLSNPAGAHTVSVEINPTSQPEDDYNNNTTEGIFTWGGANAKMDPAFYDIVPSEDPIPF